MANRTRNRPAPDGVATANVPPKTQPESSIRVRLCITGFVQGVGYRTFARRVAGVHGIDGTVRNLPDGRVQVLASGTRDNLEHLIGELRKGPARARVEDIQIEWNPDSSLFAGGVLGHRPGFHVI